MLSNYNNTVQIFNTICRRTSRYFQFPKLSTNQSACRMQFAILIKNVSRSILAAKSLKKLKKKKLNVPLIFSIFWGNPENPSSNETRIKCNITANSLKTNK